MNKQNVGCAYDKIFNHKNECSTEACQHVNGPQSMKQSERSQMRKDKYLLIPSIQNTQRQKADQ